MDVDKLIAQSSLSIFHCRSLCLLRLCTLFGKDGRQSCWILEEQNSMVFGKQSFQRYESNWWTTNGIRVEDFPTTHYNGNPQPGSTDDGRIAVWTRELHRQDHIHVNVQWHWMGQKKEQEKEVNTIYRRLRILLADFLALIGLSQGLDLKRSGTELAITNQMDLGTELQGKWCWISQNTIIQCSVVQCLRDGRFKKQRKWKEVNTLEWQQRKHWIVSPNGHLRQSAQSPRSSRGYDSRITRWSEGCGETQSTRSTG